jgi:hypothetical protein
MNASATASTCTTVPVQANGYVSEIQDDFGNFQTTVNSLGSILNTNGSVTSTSLIGAYASAIAASDDAQSSQGQTAKGAQGAQVGTTLTAAPGGLSNVSGVACTNIGSVLECVLTVPPGTSLLSVPLSASNGKVTFAVGNASSALSSLTQVAAVAAWNNDRTVDVEGRSLGRE